MGMMVSGIWIYPIKSTHRVVLGEAVVHRYGLEGDRRWMLVDEDGVFLTQREHASLALVAARIDADDILVSAPDMPETRVRRPARGAVRVRIWKDTVEAACADDDTCAWFSRYLGRPVRLVYMDDARARPVDSDFAVSDDDHVSFADGYPLLLASEESLAALNEHIDQPVPMNRFRPNVVVSGTEPFAEDGWKEIRIGAVTFRVVKGCARCVVTTVNQDTAEQGKEPLRTLNRVRKRDGKVYFGQNLIPTSTGTIRVGDVVSVVR